MILTNPHLAARFKAQLLDYVDDRDEPFDTQFLVVNYNSLVDDAWIQHALWKLEEEGRIVRLNHHYLSTHILMKRWILRPQPPELGYLDIGEFIRDALRRRIHQLENHEAERKKS